MLLHSVDIGGVYSVIIVLINNIACSDCTLFIVGMYTDKALEAFVAEYGELLTSKVVVDATNPMSPPMEFEMR